jgi:retron-type reverse transcriptase
VATNLKWIGEKARSEPDLVFTSLYHHIVDVEANLQDLSERLGRMSYRPGAKRRSYIPKAGSAQGRPLGISNFEDKIVEAAVKRTLEPIYEGDFDSDWRTGWKALG